MGYLDKSISGKVAFFAPMLSVHLWPSHHADAEANVMNKLTLRPETRWVSSMIESCIDGSSQSLPWSRPGGIHAPLYWWLCFAWSRIRPSGSGEVTSPLRVPGDPALLERHHDYDERSQG
jgi:hypothetical protein